MIVLVTGAAGFIGSVTTEQLISAGHTVIGLDNLQSGHSTAVLPEAKLIVGNFGDRNTLKEIFQSTRIDLVMHLAAETVVSESMRNPLKAFQNNVVNSLILLEEMVNAGIRTIIFSSSAAVYGHGNEMPLVEQSELHPINPYGESKLMMERMLYWFHLAYGMNSISFRYFNAAGATELFGEDRESETHLIPIVLRVASKGSGPVPIYGGDYPTLDGSAIRDFVHVSDIAQAHLLAAKLWENPGCRFYNLGSGHGYSVHEVIEAVRQITGIPILSQVTNRRPGDPATLVASNELAKSELGWKPNFPEIHQIIRSAIEWRRRYPNGYKS